MLDFGSDDPLADRAIAALYHAAPESQAPPSLRYRLLRHPDGGHEGHAPGRPVFGPAPLGEVWAFLEWRATEDVIAPREELVTLHAAGVVVGDSPALLIGDAGSGKSTLAAALLERGHLVWGDDLVRFAPERLEFSAFPRSFKLDNNSLMYLDLIPRICSESATGTFLAPECWYVSPAAIRRSWLAIPGRPRYVVLLDQRDRRGPTGAVRISEGVAALEVAQRLLGRTGGPEEQARITVQVLDALRETTALRVTGADPAASARALERELAA